VQIRYAYVTDGTVGSGSLCNFGLRGKVESGRWSSPADSMGSDRLTPGEL
jgi:hypothetical protein